MRKPLEEPLAINKRIWEFIDYIKTRSVVSIPHLEEFEKLLNTLNSAVDELRKSRDNWRKKYENLQEGIDKFMEEKK